MYKTNFSIKHPYELTEVVRRYREVSPKTPIDKIEAHWGLHLALVNQEIARGIVLATDEQLDDNKIPVNWYNLKTQQGVIQERPKRIWLRDWFHQNFPLFKIHTIGNRMTTGHQTMIELRYPLEIVAASQTPEECVLSVYSPDELEEISQLAESGMEHFVEIDMGSLERYIRSTEDVLSTKQGPEYLKTVKHSYLVAKTIRLVAEYFRIDDRHLLPQLPVESRFGRTYYRGLNLQSAPRQVRHAALGDCHQYDLSASVYHWMYTLAGTVDPEYSYTYILEYLDHKSAHRRRLADLLRVKGLARWREDLIKEVITAVGFGANFDRMGWRDNQGRWHWPAISQIIKDPQSREALKQDPWFGNFRTEVEQLQRAIFQYIKKENLIPEEDRDLLTSESGTLLQSRTLAYAYQQFESQVMRSLRDLIPQDNVLLQVHDALYTRRSADLAALRLALRKYSQEGCIDHTEIETYGYREDVSEHYELIRDEERRAREWAVKMGYKPQHSTEEEIDRKINWMLRERAPHWDKHSQGRDYDNGYRSEADWDPDWDCDLD